MYVLSWMFLCRERHNYTDVSRRNYLVIHVHFSVTDRMSTDVVYDALHTAGVKMLAVGSRCRGLYVDTDLNGGRAGLTLGGRDARSLWRGML